MALASEPLCIFEGSPKDVDPSQGLEPGVTIQLLYEILHPRKDCPTILDIDGLECNSTDTLGPTINSGSYPLNPRGRRT